VQVAADEDRRLRYENNSSNNNVKDAGLLDKAAFNKQQQEQPLVVKLETPRNKLHPAGTQRLRLN
jgi:hypothetical protein